MRPSPPTTSPSGEQGLHQSVGGSGGPIVRPGAVEYPTHDDALSLPSASRPPEDFGATVRNVGTFYRSSSDRESADGLKPPQLGGGGRRQSVTVDVPHRPHVPQEALPIRGAEACPELGRQLPYRVDDFTPIPVHACDLTRQRTHAAHQAANRAARGAEGRHRIGEQCGAVECGLGLRQNAPPGERQDIGRLRSAQRQAQGDVCHGEAGADEEDASWRPVRPFLGPGAPRVVHVPTGSPKRLECGQARGPRIADGEHDFVGENQMTILEVDPPGARAVAKLYESRGTATHADASRHRGLGRVLQAGAEIAAVEPT